MEINNDITFNEKNITVSDSELVSALSDMSKPINEIDMTETVKNNIHVIDTTVEEDKN